MKKIFLSLTVISAFIFYSLSQKVEGSIPQPISQTMMPRDTQMMMGGQYKNGEYIGDVTDAYYGNVQVRAVISGGKIADVQFLQYPKDRRTSMEINTQAMPYLKQEAIQAQNANVDIVSGATQTSSAFRQSLQSALDRARV